MHLGKYPFIRLLIPLVSGISTGYLLAEYPPCPITGLWLFFIFLATGLALYYRLRKSYTLRWMPGVVVFLLLFSTGGFLVQKTIQHVRFDWPDAPGVYEALLLSDPREHPRSYSCEARIIGYHSSPNSLETTQQVQKKVLLYFPKQETAAHLCTGTLLYAHALIAPARNHGNPEEFDYRAFLLRKGISGTGYVTDFYPGKPLSTRKGLLEHAQAIRQKLLQIYQQAGITGAEYGILSALTLGWQESLTRETRASFSNAGISHVLAVSGLHVGFVYVLLELLLSLLLPKKWVVFRQLIIVVLLWGFAFLTGLLPPVVRATLMCSMVALARIRRSRSLSVNTLGAAAFLMLCFRPLLWFDLSFQLSFSALAGILLWQPWLFRLLPCRTRVVKYIWGIITVSLAAQLAVLPFILCYFSSFPCYFLLTNVATITLVSILMYTAFLLLALTPFPLLQQAVSWLLQKEIHGLQFIVEGVEQLPGSHLARLHVPFGQACWIALCILGGMWYLTSGQKARKALLLLCVGICGVLGSEVLKNYQRLQPPQLIFYANSNAPVLHLIADKECTYLWGDSTSAGFASFVTHVSGYWDKLGLSEEPLYIPFHPETSFLTEDARLYSVQGILRFQGTTICHINDRRWERKTTVHPLPVDYLWISKGYYGDVRSLQALFVVREVVIDASVPLSQQSKLEEECRALGLPCLNIRKQGAYLVKNIAPINPYNTCKRKP